MTSASSAPTPRRFVCQSARRCRLAWRPTVQDLGIAALSAQAGLLDPLGADRKSTASTLPGFDSVS